MNSSDAMIVWTPNREPFLETPSRGKVAVTTIPEHPATTDHTHSAGACDHDWKTITESERQERIRELARQMVEEDNIPKDEIDRELAKID